MQAQGAHSPTYPKREAYQKLWFLLASVGAVFLVFATYVHHLDQGFQLSDRQVVQDNLYIENLEILPQLIRDPYASLGVPDELTYRPILALSFALDHWIAGGMDPRAYRLSQILLMVVLGIGFAAWFGFLLNRVAEGWSNRYFALLAAVLFCVHMANAGMLSDMTSRASLLGTLGVVGSFVMYGYLPSWRPSHLYLLPMMFGTLAHPLALLFAPLLLVYGLFFEKRLSCQEICTTRAWPKVKHALGKTFPAFFTGMGLLLFLDSVSPYHQPGGGNVADSLFLQPFLWLHYVWLFVMPYGTTQNLIWEAPLNLMDLRLFAGVLCILILGRITWLSSRTKELRPVAFGIIWFILGVLNTENALNFEEWTTQPQVLFPFLGLMSAVMMWIAHCLRNNDPGFMRRNPVGGILVGGLVMVMLAIHLVGTYQLKPRDPSMASSQQVSVEERVSSHSQRL